MRFFTSFLRPLLTIWTIALAPLALGFVAGDRAQAQNAAALTATYGRGVHAYFANQVSLAEQLLSQVIDAGSTDPRVYYFRAMTRMRSGRSDEAEVDMQIGAAFEARDPGNRLAIGKALERVQGPNRLLLEGFRQQARLERLQQRQQQTVDRYEQLRLREPDVLRREWPVPLEDLVEPSLELPGATDKKPAPETPVPVAEPEGMKSVPTPPQPVPPAEPTDDIFGGDAAEETDIFSEPQQPAAESEPPAEPAESTDPAPTEDDPFSEPEPSPEPVNEDDPFAAAQPAAESGGAPAEVAEATSPSGDVELTDSDRIESSQMLRVLGRVAASVFPWRGLEMPAMGPTSGPEEFDSEFEPTGIELGPADEEAPVIRASAEQPIEAEDDAADPFGGSAGDASEQPTDDPFGGPADDPFGGAGSDDAPPTAAPAAEDEEHTESEQPAADPDDPFADF